jgi:rhodanese-related sulfurtransferase
MKGVEIFRQAAAILTAGFAAGLALNTLSPRPVPLGQPVYAAAESAGGVCTLEPSVQKPLPRISVEEASALCAACTAGFVDARSAREYAAGHVSGAIHLPPVGHPDEAAALAPLAQYRTVVVYDGDPSCQLAEGVARRLAAEGLPDVRVLAGAWPAWAAAGGPGASGACALGQHAPEARR